MSIKQLIKKIFLNRKFIVARGNLKGVKLVISPYLNASVLWKDYEPDKQLAIKLFTNDGDVFFDVGSNVGLHAYLVAKQFPGNKIFAIEPLPANNSYLEKTIALNGFTNITLLKTACGADEGEIFFSEGETGLQGHITGESTNLKVKLTTLDHIIDEYKVYPSLIKIDVEGAETDVLEGFKKNIQLAQPIMIIELHSPAQDRMVADFLVANNYHVYRLSSYKKILPGNKLLEAIKNMQATWPDPEGVFGSIVAIPPKKMDACRQFIAV